MFIGRVEFFVSMFVDIDIIYFEGGVFVDFFVCVFFEDFGFGFSNS